MKNFNLIATFKDYKKSGINVNRKNDRVDADGKDIEDNEEDIKDSIIDIESIVDFNINVVNSGEVDKDVGDNTFVLPSSVRKEDGDANKSVWGFRKRVKNAVKDD